jgi:hypothetical protein
MKKRLVIFLLAFIALTAIPLTAQAAISPDSFVKNGCTLTHVLVQNSVPQSVEDYLATMPKISSKCQTEAVNNYYFEVDKWIQLYNASFGNEFTRRYNNCTNFTGLSVNPTTWVTSLRCLVMVAAVPTSNAIKVNLINVKNQFMTHQPTSYVAVGASVIKDVYNNWGTMTCDNAKGIITTIQFKQGVNTVIAIPCKPPTALQPLRKFAVFSVWLSLLFWIYYQGMAFVRDLIK